MREIKFRAWDVYFKKMFRVKRLEFLPDGINVVLDDDEESYSDGCEIMQYTGLKDKSGKEIYEGDILEYDFLNDRENGVVEFKGDGWWVSLLASLKAVGQLSYAINYLNPKIIGNIHENPELKEKL